VISCPVCEHQQPGGAECEVCGRGLVALGGVDAPVAPLDGLEPTALDGGGWVGEVAALAELEPTLQASAGAVTPVPIPELEPTMAAPVEAQGELVPDLEPTAAPASGDAPTEVPLFLTCRYCRTPAGPGDRICGRCGMQLQVQPGPAPEAALAGRRFCSCGTPISRSICPACGARNRVE
jgi:hypothetical protein